MTTSEQAVVLATAPEHTTAAAAAAAARAVMAAVVARLRQLLARVLHTLPHRARSCSCSSSSGSSDLVTATTTAMACRYCGADAGRSSSSSSKVLLSSLTQSPLLLLQQSRRLVDRVPAAWMSGAVTLLAVAYTIAPGRRLARGMALPRVCRFHVAAAPRNAARAQLRRRSPLGKFLFLLRMAVPSLRSREAALIAAQTCLMLVRAALSLCMARATGRLATAAVRGNARVLFATLAHFAALFTPAALLDATLTYLREVQELCFRANVARCLATRYLRARVFYRLAGLHEVDLIDQRLTDDVQRWTAVSSVVFTSITRPLVEAVAFSLLLARRARWRGVALGWGYYLAYTGIAAVAAPNNDWLLTQRMEREGALRAAHQRIRAHAVEVAVMGGYACEAAQLRRRFAAVAEFARYAAFVHARYNVLETLYTKQGSVLVFYGIAALALLGGGGSSSSSNDSNSGSSTSSDGSALLSSSTMLTYFGEMSFAYKSLAKAIGRLLWNIRLVFAINGYTQRLYQLVEALEAAERDVAAVQAQQQQQQQQQQLCVTNGNGHAIAAAAVATTSEDDDDDDKANIVQHKDADTHLQQQQQQASSALPSCGQIRRDDYIEFVDVPLALPTGEVLCAALSFYVKPGMNLLIVGPNGCGKTSTFRLLGELWPLRAGCIVKPERAQLYYLPQRPYMYDGTLFDQILYPTSRARAHVSEAALYDCVVRAGLEGIFARPGVSWSARLPWRSSSVLSAGEKQRLAMARLFYHRPRFAILDECSSTLDHALEARFYAQCRELGITVLTIAHRRSVWRYHNWILYFDGAGGYMFSPLRLDTSSSNSNSSNNSTTMATMTDAASPQALVLTRVVSSNDAACVGSEVRVPVTGLWHDDGDGDGEAKDAADVRGGDHDTHKHNGARGGKSSNGKSSNGTSSNGTSSNGTTCSRR